MEKKKKVFYGKPKITKLTQMVMIVKYTYDILFLSLGLQRMSAVLFLFLLRDNLQ